jgi:hypothetical protein
VRILARGTQATEDRRGIGGVGDREPQDIFGVDLVINLANASSWLFRARMARQFSFCAARGCGTIDIW